MDWRKLHSFRVLASELHFRKASEKLFISQPALSKQIRELEAGLGLTLIVRDNRNVRLNRAGVYLNKEISTLEDHWRKIERNLQLIDRGEEGELRIGFVGSAMQVVIAKALVLLNQSYPGIHTHLQEISNQAQIESVLLQRLDAGFIRTEQRPAGIESKLVLKENFCIALPKDHWLTERKFESLMQLKSERFILFGTAYSPDYYDLIWSIFSDQGFVPEVSHRSVHAATIFKLVESHLGIAIVPKSLTHGFDLDVKFVELRKIRQKTHLYLIWKAKNQDAMLHRFIDLF